MNTLTQRARDSVLWGGFRVWQRNWDAFLRSWKVEVGGIVVEPFIFLITLGFGLGFYIQNIDGASYAQFLAPGVVAAYSMFHATFDSTFGAYLRMEANHIYEAILFTPLGPEDIVVGEVMSAATRGLLSGTVVVLAATMFGLVGSPLAVLAIPAAYLIGLMFAAIAMLMTATASTIGAMNNFFTLFILPMFYVSGVFFPLDQLPQPVQIASRFLPLTPAVSLVRGLMTGDLSWLTLLWLAQIVAYLVVSLVIASALMRRRLIK